KLCWARCPRGSCQRSHFSTPPPPLWRSFFSQPCDARPQAPPWAFAPEDMATRTFVFCSVLVVYLPGCWTLECFKCVSVDGSNPHCEDPFHNNYSTTITENPCMGGRKGRNGVFPASACIKLKGVYASGQHMVVRGCALDSGSLTVDTELVRMSHCGGFYFDDKYVSGCVQSCFEEACNGHVSRLTDLWTVHIVAFLLFMLCLSSSWNSRIS
uniref:Uncharacterized protein n=1 Tax=Strigamia maritima TaxID=126957 RepID=T1IID5_STRMM